MTGLEGLFKLRNAQPSSINHLLPIFHYFWAVKAIPESPGILPKYPFSVQSSGKRGILEIPLDHQIQHIPSVAS
jgi:hypothetical protein